MIERRERYRGTDGLGAGRWTEEERQKCGVRQDERERKRESRQRNKEKDAKQEREREGERDCTNENLQPSAVRAHTYTHSLCLLYS